MKKTIIIYTIFILLLLIYTGYSSISYRKTIFIKEKQIEVLMQNSLKNAIEKEDILYFKDIASFEWDYMAVFGPYTLKSDIKESLNVNWKPGRTALASLFSDIITVDESEQLFVFVKDNRVISYFFFSRSFADFNNINKIIFKPEDAIFKIKKSNSENPIVEVAQY